MSELYRKTGRVKEADELSKRVASMRENKHPAKH
jgi:hypothetical protein